MADRSTATIRKLAGWLALTVLATLLFGVFALYLTDQANDRQLDDFKRILRVVDTTRLAQVHFKTQVQEWKNVLLRGQDASDYERYLGQFHTQSAETIDQLHRAAATKQQLGLDTADVEAALQEHDTLMGHYQQGLSRYQRGDVGSVFAVDTEVRGKDRQLNEMIDGIAEAMVKEADRRTALFAEQDRSRYLLLRSVFIVLATATLALAGWLVVLTLRRRDVRD